MITIYHNSRCSKSREGLCFLQNMQHPITIVNYLEDKLTKTEIESILQKLQLPAIDLVRKKESIWITEFKNKNLTQDQIIDAMVQYPKLIERPIVICNDKAVIARPADKINDIL